MTAINVVDAVVSHRREAVDDGCEAGVSRRVSVQQACQQTADRRVVCRPAGLLMCGYVGVAEVFDQGWERGGVRGGGGGEKEGMEAV